MIKKRPAPARNPKKPAQVLRVNVSDIAFGGDGIARTEGKVIFVEHTVPGEIVEAEVFQDKKRFARARSLRILEPAPDAVKPFCPVFGTCGGCNWQHVPYAKQLEWKATFIHSALVKTARLENPPPVVVLPSNAIAHYRNRIKLKARLSRRSSVAIIEFGYFAKGSHTPVFIAACPIADKSINNFLEGLSGVEFPGSLRWQGDMEVQALADGRRLLHFSPDFPRIGLDTLRERFPSESIASPGFALLEESLGLQYATQPGQFQQVNLDSNRYLRQWIRSKIQLLECRTVLDLFCGSGNLSLGLLADGVEVWGLELAEPAISTALENLRINAIDRGSYKAGAVADLHTIFNDLPTTLDCVLVDPPRQGMDDSLPEILKLRPKHILSVSCDPNTFARDLHGFLEGGYEQVDIFGIDFFPHTYHVETVAHLVRRD